jgi:hypothetical protein
VTVSSTTIRASFVGGTTFEATCTGLRDRVAPGEAGPTDPLQPHASTLTE